MSTTLNFIRPVQLRPGAASVLIGSKTLLQRHQLTASPFSPLLKPVLDGKTAINFVWNEQAEQLIVALLGDERSRNMGSIRADLIPAIIANLPAETDAHLTFVVPSPDAISPVTAAIAKAFPLFNQKSAASRETNRNINISYNCPDQPQGISQDALDHAQHLAESVRLTARLVDTPPAEMSTTTFLKEAEQMAQSLGDAVKIESIVGEDLLKKGMGGIYNVGKASTTPPAFIHLSYTPKKCASDKHIAFVGKGIVYDSGGLTIKVGGNMCHMKADMAGAAAILGAFQLLVQTGFSAPLDAILCVAENCVGPNSLRNDDIIRSYSGRTTEINNTDAEGRLVLSDGVAFASKDTKATHIIDIASLTGAQLVTTGNMHAALLSNDADFESLCFTAGQTSGDFTFPVLYAPEILMQEFESKVADAKNSVANRMNAQASCAGHFIGSHLDENWLKAGKWAHIDAAGPTFTADRATGFGVNLLATIAHDVVT